MKKRIFVVVWLLALCLHACNTEQQQGRAEIDFTDPFQPVIKTKLNRQQIENGKKAGWETVFGLFIINGGKTSTTNVACKYTLIDDSLFMTPQLPLGTDLYFVVKISGSENIFRFDTPINPIKSADPAVENIYPLSSSIPANVLMFHVVFTHSMNEDARAYNNVKLLDENGQEKTLVWREKSNWTTNGKHLVLMLHPGRIKRGIDYGGNGALFEIGKKYTLVITTELKDENNRPLLQQYTKTFTAINPDREIPVFVADTAHYPPKGTTYSLPITFTEAMDYGAMQIGVTVKNNEGKKVYGSLQTNDDVHWHFIPAEAWAHIAYTIELNDYITDYCGNHLNRRFEEQDINTMKKRNSHTFGFMPH